MKFTKLGSDPEFFVFDPKGRPYPATLFAVGTKDKPIPIESLGAGFFEQRDNLSFEGNIPPATTKEDFILNMCALREFFAKKVARVGYSLSPNGVEYFEKKYLNTDEGKEFGCSSVISSWDSSLKNGIVIRATPNLTGCKFRVAGFHIHIEYDADKFIGEIPKRYLDILIGRLFDIFVTLPSHTIKNEPERIQTYGKFGMIRSKDYGVECRTLSSYFTQADQLPWVWDQIIKIADFINASDISDLKLLISKSYLVAHGDIPHFSYYIKNLLKELKNTKSIELFDETKKIYDYKSPYYDSACYTGYIKHSVERF